MTYLPKLTYLPKIDLFTQTVHQLPFHVTPGGLFKCFYWLALPACFELTQKRNKQLCHEEVTYRFNLL